MNEAKLYFDLLRAWMENPTLIGGPKAEVGISKLGDVMCFTGLACEFYEIETDQSKRAKERFILWSPRASLSSCSNLESMISI